MRSNVVLAIVVFGSVVGAAAWYHSTSSSVVPRQQSLSQQTIQINIESSSFQAPVTMTENLNHYSNVILGIAFDYPKDYTPWLQENFTFAGQPNTYCACKDSYVTFREFSSTDGFTISYSNSDIDQEVSYIMNGPGVSEGVKVQKLVIQGQEALVVTPPDDISDPGHKRTTLLFLKLKKTIPLTKDIMKGADQEASKEMTAIEISVTDTTEGDVMKTIVASLHFV